MLSLSADIIEKFYTFLWPLTRIGAVIMTAPLFATESANARLRLMLTLVVTYMVYPLLDWPRLDPLSASGLIALLNQVAIGIVMGVSLQIIVSAMVVAGQAVSATMGLSMANLMDPTLGNVPVLSQFLLIMGSLVFLDLGGHILVIQSVIDSFTLLPIGSALISVETIGKLITWSSMMFLGGVLIALPVMVSLLLVNIGVGIMTRAAPSLNIFSVGFPAMLAAGYVILLVCVGSMSERIRWLWQQGFSHMRDILGMG
jgi:flagellar biosynthetic protein FliR